MRIEKLGLLEITCFRRKKYDDKNGKEKKNTEDKSGKINKKLKSTQEEKRREERSA